MVAIVAGSPADAATPASHRAHTSRAPDDDGEDPGGDACGAAAPAWRPDAAGGRAHGHPAAGGRRGAGARARGGDHPRRAGLAHRSAARDPLLRVLRRGRRRRRRRRGVPGWDGGVRAGRLRPRRRRRRLHGRPGGGRPSIGSSPWPTPARRSSSAWATTGPARSSCASPTSRTVAGGRSTSMAAAGPQCRGRACPFAGGTQY
jgi:hypothetical protein